MRFRRRGPFNLKSLFDAMGYGFTCPSWEKLGEWSGGYSRTFRRPNFLIRAGLALQNLGNWWLGSIFEWRLAHISGLPAKKPRCWLFGHSYMRHPYFEGLSSDSWVAPGHGPGGSGKVFGHGALPGYHTEAEGYYGSAEFCLFCGAKKIGSGIFLGVQARLRLNRWNDEGVDIPSNTLVKPKRRSTGDLLTEIFQTLKPYMPPDKPKDKDLVFPSPPAKPKEKGDY